MTKDLGLVTPLYSPEENDIHEYVTNMASSVLAQNFDFFWIIVVDGLVDRCTKQLLEKISIDPRVRIHERERKPQDRRTASNALNEGLNIIFNEGCKYSTYVHADDMLTQDSLDSRVRELKNNGAVYGRMGFVEDEKVWIRKYPAGYNFHSTSVLRDGFPHHTSMWSRGLIELMMRDRNNQIFNGAIECGEDLDVTLYSRRLIKRYGLSLSFVEGVVYLKVEHDKNITSNLGTKEKIRQTQTVYRMNGYNPIFLHLRRPFFWLPENIKEPLRPLQRLASKITCGFLYPTAQREWTDIDPYWFRTK